MEPHGRRRLVALASPLLLVGVAAILAAPAPAGGQAAAPPPDALSRGLRYDGLRDTDLTGPCGGGYRLDTPGQAGGAPVCTHGPDPAPDGVDVQADREPPPPRERAASAAQVPCVGDGSSGFRVQLIYARAANRTDGYAEWLPSMQEWAARIDDVFDASAAETGGSRHVAFVHDAGCVAVVDKVVLSNSGDDDFDATYGELRAKGYGRSDRKYLVWVDANVYCGIAEIQYDDDPSPDNASNGNPEVGGEIGRVDKGCWGKPDLVEVHELVHLLGGVQRSAPNGTYNNHCRDEYDRLCYNDGGGATFVACADAGHENRLDCNHDDYYSTDPPSGGYLVTHWNVARSRFLVTPAVEPLPAGSTFYSDGAAWRTARALSTVTAYGVGARPGVGYLLTAGRASGSDACAVDTVALNPSVRYAGADGLIGRTSGPIDRPAGQWQVCFRALDGSTSTAPVTVTVI